MFTMTSRCVCTIGALQLYILYIPASGRPLAAAAAYNTGPCGCSCCCCALFLNLPHYLQGGLAHCCSFFRCRPCLVCCVSALLHTHSYLLHSVYSVLKLSLDLIEGLRSLLCSGLGFSLCNSKGITDRAKVRRMLRLQHERQCTADYISSEVCWHGLASIALDNLQDVVKKGAEGSSMLA
jgi:hypothetical protein